MNKRKNVAIILAGGVGSRSGLDIPKQFYKLAGKTVIEHTISTFEHHPKIDEIAIVTRQEYFEKIEEIIIHNNFTKCKKTLHSGTERYHSTISAIKAYENEANINLIIHDAVRPLISDRIINDCVEALQTYYSIDVAIPSTDTIIETKNRLLENIPNRDNMWNGQTPQCFHLEVLKKAYELALSDPEFQTTDDCKIVNKYLSDVDTYIVKGEKSNMKLTYQEDIHMLESFFQIKMNEDHPDISLEQLKDKTIVVFGGTGGIGKSICDLAQKYGANIIAYGRRNGVDISDEGSVREALQKISTPINAVIVTAALLKKEPLHSMSYDVIKEITNINYLGSIICAKESYSYLKESKGCLLLFSSSSYTKGRSFYTPYSSSKAAIVNLTQGLAEEWHTVDIKVNCINPERTQTEMRATAFGYEDPATLLSPDIVAEYTLKSIFLESSGQVISIRK